MPKEFIFLENARLKALIDLFNALFGTTYHTQLVAGGSEPIYLPSDEENSVNRVVFTRDYFSSALHEIAHWSIAGEPRRKLVDYGYWYCPDGRDDEQQKAFEIAEVKPQALERIFSKAAGEVFHISADNLESGAIASDGFVKAIHRQTLDYCDKGLPVRAEIFASGLIKTFSPDSDVRNIEGYHLEELFDR